MHRPWKWAAGVALSVSLVACGSPSSPQVSPDTTASGATVTSQDIAIPGVVRTISAAGTANLRSGGLGSDALQYPEFGPEPGIADGPDAPNSLSAQKLDVHGKASAGVNRRLPGTRSGRGVSVVNFGAQKVTAAPTLT
ncbi:hypothetical protein, partial [Deinococcus sp.]|uniref:hypothetical protein n=1 Tax=Deinococcus sp. TaxID=47478 RepID=UPI002869BD03